METIFKIAIASMILTSILCLYRGILGPSITDRIIVVNTINTKVVIILALSSCLFNNYCYLDVAIVYAMMSFIFTIAVAKHKWKGKIT